MFEEIKYLIRIEHPLYSTYYFMHRPQKIILPIQIYTGEINRLRDAPCDTCWESVEKNIQHVGGILNHIKIYLYLEGKYYTYVSLKKEETFIDINSDFTDALRIALSNRLPIFTSLDIILNRGFKVTQKMIRKALAR